MPSTRQQLAAERSPVSKGERTLQRIIEAAADIIQALGLANTSQEAVAKRAGISQSTLRHHFATKEGLIEAAFARVYENIRHRAEAVLMEPCTDPLERIEQMADAHISYVMEAREAYTFECFAHFSRNREEGGLRDQWYIWITGHYASLIQQLHPALSPKDCAERAYLVLHLCLGGWFTLTQSGPRVPGLSREQIKALVLAQIRQLAQSP